MLKVKSLVLFCLIFVLKNILFMFKGGGLWVYVLIIKEVVIINSVLFILFNVYLNYVILRFKCFFSCSI